MIVHTLYYTKVINRIISLFFWDTIEKEEIYEILDHNTISHMRNETLSYELDDDNDNSDDKIIW